MRIGLIIDIKGDEESDKESGLVEEEESYDYE